MSYIISRYISRIFLSWFTIVALVVMAIILLFDFTELLRKASSRADINLGIILRMMVYKLPGLMQQVVLFITLFAGIFTFWRLNRHRELEVMRALGVSIWQMLAPMMVCGLLIGVFELVVVNPISAKMMLRYEHLNNRVFHSMQESLSISPSGLWLREAKGDVHTILHVRHIDSQSQTLHNITLLKFHNKDQFMERIDAFKGRIDGETLILEKGWKASPNQYPESFETIQVETSFTYTSILDTGAEPYSISFWELPHFIDMMEKSGLSGVKYAMHWHTSISKVIWLCVMCLLAALCCLRSIRQRGTLLIIVASVGVAFLLYFFKDLTYALGSSGTIPIVLAAWAPTGISALFGVSLLLHFEDG